MDFTAIWEQLQGTPIVQLAIELAKCIVLCATAIKAYLVLKANKANASSTLNQSTEMLGALGGDLKMIMQNAIPSTMKIDVSNLIDKRVEDALLDIKAEIMKSVTAELAEVSKKQELTLLAVSTLSRLSDTLKEEISENLSPKPIETVLTIPLLKSEVEKHEQKVEKLKVEKREKKAEAANVPID